MGDTGENNCRRPGNIIVVDHGILLQQEEQLLSRIAVGFTEDQALLELLRRMSLVPENLRYTQVDLVVDGVTILPTGSGGWPYGPIIINPPSNIAEGFRVEFLSALGGFTPLPARNGGSIYGTSTVLKSDGKKLAIATRQGSSLPKCARSETFTIRIHHSGGPSQDFTLKLPIELRIKTYPFPSLRFRPGVYASRELCAAGEPGPMNWAWIPGNGTSFPPPGMSFGEDADGNATLSGIPGAGDYLATGHFLVVQSNNYATVPATVRVGLIFDEDSDYCDGNISLVPGEFFRCELPRPSEYSNYTWRLTSGNLPPGLALIQPTGMRWYVEGTVPIITASGTPVNTHNVEFKLRVPGLAADLASHQLTFTIGIPFSVLTQNTILRPNVIIFPNTGDDNEQRTDFMLDWINHGEFDIIALQEVFDNDQRNQFATGYSINEFNLLWGPTYSPGIEDESGLALFVRGDPNVDFFTRWTHLVSNHETGLFAAEMPVPPFLSQVCEGGDCFAWKGYSITKVPIGPNDQEFVWVVNTHLQASYEDGDETEYENIRRWQLERIILHLAATRFQSHPVILLGDLNIIASESEYRARFGDLLSDWEDPVRAEFCRFFGRANPSCGELPFTNDETRNAYAHFFDDHVPHPGDQTRLDYILIRQGSDFQVIVDEVALEDNSAEPDLCRDTFPLQGHPGMSCYLSDHYGLSARMRLVRIP